MSEEASVTAAVPPPADATEPAPTEHGALGAGRSAGIVAAVLMGLLLGALDNFIVVTALPQIAASLNDTSGQVFVVTGYLIAQTVAIPIFGKLSDRFGRRSFYLLGLVIFLVGSAASGLAQTLDQLIVFRAVQGVGSGAFFTVVFSIIADLFPPKEAARLVGFLSGVFGVAIVFGPLIGSYIVDTTTWRWIFFVNLPVGAVAIALVLLTMGPLRRSITKVRFDTVGAALLAGWVGALIFALVETSQPDGWAWTDPRTLGLLAGVAVLLPLFLYAEARADDPLVPLHYFRNSRIAAASGVNFLRGGVLTAVVTYVPLLVVQGLGGTTDLSRDVLYAFMVPMIVGAAIGGALTARFGYRLPVVLGLFSASIGCLFLTQVPTVPPIFRWEDGFLLVGLAGALIPVGIGLGLTFAPTQLAIQYSVPAKDVGTGNSLVWFLGNLGGSIVLSGLGSYQLHVIQHLLATSPPTSQAAAVAIVAQSIQSVWWLVLPFAIAAFVSALFLSGRLPVTDPSTGQAPVAAPGM